MLNSTLDTLAEDTGSDNVKWFTYSMNFQYLSGSSYVTGSDGKIVVNNTHLALDGYQLFGEPIQSFENGNAGLESSSVMFPRMTDGPTTQSVYTTCEGNTYNSLWQPELITTIAFYDWEPPVGKNGFLTTGFSCNTSTGESFTVGYNAITASREAAGLTGSNDIFVEVDTSPAGIAYIYESLTTASFQNVTWYEIDFLTYGDVPYGLRRVSSCGKVARCPE